MSVFDNIIALLVIFGPPFVFIALVHLTGFVLFIPLIPLSAFVSVGLVSRFAAKRKPKAPPAKGWSVDKS